MYTLFDHPAHPYTIGLISSIPNLISDKREKLNSIPGSVPLSYQSIKGCRFCKRCSRACARCENEPSPLREVSSGHYSRCLLAEEIAGGKEKQQ